MTQRPRSPVLGYNHNLRHHGRVFHVQTEDSGTAYARVYTHLFFEGTILSSKKREYEAQSSEDTVRALMQQLHKEMIRELTHGGYDPHISAFFAARGEPAALDLPGASSSAVPVAVAPAVSAPAVAVTTEAIVGEAVAGEIVASEPAAAPAAPDPALPTVQVPGVMPSEMTPSGLAPPPPASVTPPPVVGRPVPPRPKPVVVVKPTNVKRPPVVLSSSADGVVVRRNVVINVGGGAPPVSGPVPASITPPPIVARTPEPIPVRARPAAGVVVRDGSYGSAGTAAPAVATPSPAPSGGAGGQGGQRVPAPAPPPQPLASSHDIQMPWERSAPPAPVVAAPEPPRASRQIRMPWDPPAPAATESFRSDLVTDKRLDEVILEYLSDDPEPENR